MQTRPEVDAAGNPVEGGGVPAVAGQELPEGFDDRGVLAAANELVDTISELIHGLAAESVWAYYKIGEEFWKGTNGRKPAYGAYVMRTLEAQTGICRNNFQYAKNFAKKYSRERIEEIREARPECSWSWFVELARIKNDDLRAKFERMIMENDPKDGIYSARDLAWEIRDARIKLKEIEGKTSKSSDKDSFDRTMQEMVAKPPLAFSRVGPWFEKMEGLESAPRDEQSIKGAQAMRRAAEEYLEGVEA